MFLLSLVPIITYARGLSRVDFIEIFIIVNYFVYKITNQVNGKIYIGKTNNIRVRWNKHKRTAIVKTQGQFSYLHKAMNKYGAENFSIETLGEYDTEAEALNQESYYINLLHANERTIGYNLTLGGDGSLGYKHTEETIKLLCEIRKGTQTGVDNNFYGKKHTEETKKKIGKLNAETLKGANNPAAILTEHKVLEIRVKRANGATLTQLAIEYKVGITTIVHIVNRDTWRHI